MSFLSALFSPGTRRKVGDFKNSLNQEIAGDSDFYRSGDLGLYQPGSAANGLINQASSLGAQTIAPNYTVMDADAARLQGLGAEFAARARDGGLAEAAATRTGNADIGEASMGGLGGVAQSLATGKQVMARTSEVGSKERAQNYDAAISDQGALLQQQIAKMSMDLDASHANHQNAMAAAAIHNNLFNQQQDNQLALQDAANQARSGSSTISQNVSNTDWAAAMQVAGAALAGGSSLGAAGLNATQANAAAPFSTAAISQAVNAANSLTLKAPSTNLSLASTQGASPYTPGALSNQYPLGANYWAIPSSTSIAP